MSKIRYCCRNFKQGTGTVYKAFKDAYPDVKQKKKDCLGECRLCSRECFAVVGKSKKVIRASSPKQLYRKLKEKIG